MRPRLALLLASSLLACADPGPRPQPPPTPTPPPPPEPVAVAEPPAPAPPPSGPQFTLAAYRDEDDMALAALADDVFVLADFELAHLERDELVRVTTDRDHAMDYSADHYDWQISAFGGRWPDAAYAVTERRSPREAIPVRLHRREGDRWTPVKIGQGLLRRAYSDFLPWHSNQVLGVRMFVPDAERMISDEEGVRLPLRLEARYRAEIAAAAPGFDILGTRITPAPMRVPQGYAIHTAAAAPTGELFAILDDATPRREPRETDDPDEVLPPEPPPLPSELIRWGLTGDAAITGAREVLPPDIDWYTVIARTADDVYLAGVAADPPYTRLRRFDGATWSDIPVPGDSRFVDLAVAPDGPMWLLLAGKPNTLWLRSTHAADWQPVALPDITFPPPRIPAWDCLHTGPVHGRCRRTDGAGEPRDPLPFDPRAVLAREGGDVWLSGWVETWRDPEFPITDYRHAVLRTRETPSPLRFPTVREVHHEHLADQPADRWDPMDPCHGPVSAVLHTRPGDAPTDDRDPLVEAFLRDNPSLHADITEILDELHRDQRVVRVQIRVRSKPARAALAAALERAAPGVPHPIDCRRPAFVVRDFDRTTGAPRPPTLPKR